MPTLHALSLQVSPQDDQRVARLLVDNEPAVEDLCASFSRERRLRFCAAAHFRSACLSTSGGDNDNSPLAIPGRCVPCGGVRVGAGLGPRSRHHVRDAACGRDQSRRHHRRCARQHLRHHLRGGRDLERRRADVRVRSARSAPAPDRHRGLVHAAARSRVPPAHRRAAGDRLRCQEDPERRSRQRRVE